MVAKRSEKGFTLIELLIVVAILGILAAVVIPNVGRFFGRGQEEAARAEFRTIQSAIDQMKIDNSLTSLANPVTGQASRTNDMSAFPDSSAAGAAGKTNDKDGNAFQATLDKNGWLLYNCDVVGDGAQTGLARYVSMKTTQFWYSYDADGTVHQYDKDGTQLRAE